MDQGVAYALVGDQALVQRADLDQMIDRFRSACFLGQARFKAGEATRIPFEALPNALQRVWVRNRTNINVVKLAVEPPAYLLTLQAEQPVKRDGASSFCALALNRGRLSYSWKQLTGVVLHEGERKGGTTFAPVSAEQVMPDAEHILNADDVGEGYIVLKVSGLNGQQKAKAMKERDHEQRRSPPSTN